ncbi:MAG TPA: alpha/beta fold hydrolase [Gammaproteobacteria bacterium]|nr:alpha/beta fold hydrolase [Gammaproteobacteria bacterium]
MIKQFQLRQFVVPFIIAACLVCGSAMASDLAKEKRWAEQVVDSLLDGEAVWLDDGSESFLGIYTEAVENKNRAVIVMHGTGIHPDWQQVIQPLRVGLSEYNWNTLSIQMPILANDAVYAEYAPLYDEVAPRIDAAIRYLHDHGSQEIVLVGHSQGSAMAAYYLATSKQDIKAFVAIGLASSKRDPRMNSLNSLKEITIPILDLYGTEDLQGIIRSAGLRVDAVRDAGNKNYTQRQMMGNHFFDGQETMLVEAVASWLEQR